ncbi:MAG: hypothetical protein DCC68_08580 [Planctomycetota bacterium]|nr:MAG: hypothetical protein DCC68_08580 [Planctomycetota bacterium]
MRIARILLTVVVSANAAWAEAENPAAREILESDELAVRWEFDRPVEPVWHATHDCSAESRDGVLAITSRGDDPYLLAPADIDGGPLKLTLRVRAKAGGAGAIYWATDKAPIGEGRRVTVPLVHDGAWREVAVRFRVDGRLRTLRLDPGTAAGTVEVDWMRITRWRQHPLAIERIESSDDALAIFVRNDDNAGRNVNVNGQSADIAPGAAVRFDVVPEGKRPLERIRVLVQSPGLPAIERTVSFHRPAVEADWLVRKAGPLELRVARDGSLARVFRSGKLTAVLGPIVHVGGEIPTFAARDDGDAIRLESGAVRVRLLLEGDELRTEIESRAVCEGPCLRVVGDMRQAVFAGLEYMELGDTSSSQLDVETEEHLRFAPPLRHVTMPLAAVATERCVAAMAWDDMTLQPVFASPNVYDGTADHRIALRGKRIVATIRFFAGASEHGDERGGIEEAILWAVKRRGLPSLPAPPRSTQAQQALDLATLNGPLRTRDGWGHCIEPHWGRAPFGDMASTLWRLGGEVPELPRIVPGGAHIRNDSIYFASGRAEEWLRQAKAEIARHIAAQQPDGSYRYDGPYRRGHFENTASGLCATHAARLLELAHLTGNKEALAAGVRTLDYMKRFRVPRGAQTWEVPLHTPDLLGSAYLVWVYVRGYELTGDKSYLAEARRWALSGMPFVYQWSDRPVMAYSTIAVLGATNWQAPYWIGLPVQWVGGVYAYALGLLAPHDATLDWRNVARGILIAARQMQYPDGPNAGTLPDSFALSEQERRPWNINPCALVSLERLLDGKVDSLAVARSKERHVVAPFPVRIDENRAIIDGIAGTRYQVIVDGRRIVDVTSQGKDTVDLAP